ncbi:MAG: Tad domain-containing protein [Vicinamibacterales bacterium]|jgi:hypothetical protein|nr:Tad domain-containing protein [Vicinamibacterales bacterium]
MTLVFVGVGFMAFLSATMLAIDVGMFMVARTQAQNSADAGALAGAVALVFDDFNDRTASGPAVQNAVVAAQSNEVMSQVVSVTPADVTFPTPERVRVDVFRTSGRANPVATMVAPLFGLPIVDIQATATADAVPANAATCVKPWAVPDKWQEMQTPPWDSADSFDAYVQNGPNRGQRIPNADIFVPADQPGYTGYQQSPSGPDYGRQVVLKQGNPHQTVSASDFFPIALPPNSGAAWYEQNIPGCWPEVAGIGERIPVEPGNQVGPTLAGTQRLIDQDPGAYWDAATRRVVTSLSPSPRIVVLPVYNPDAYDSARSQGRTEIEISNFVGFFIENIQGTDVVGRVVPNTGLLRTGVPAPTGAFLRAIRLVE